MVALIQGYWKWDKDYNTLLTICNEIRDMRSKTRWWILVMVCYQVIPRYRFIATSVLSSFCYYSGSSVLQFFRLHNCKSKWKDIYKRVTWQFNSRLGKCTKQPNIRRSISWITSLQIKACCSRSCYLTKLSRCKVT